MPTAMGVMAWTLFHSYWMPAHDMPTRKLVRPPMKRNPPTQSTRQSLEASDVLTVVSLT
jgi:hypothetical protein